MALQVFPEKQFHSTAVHTAAKLPFQAVRLQKNTIHLFRIL